MKTPKTGSKELFAVLEDLPEVPLEGGQRARSVIDWDAWRQNFVDRSWFQIGDITKEILAELKENGHLDKKVYYSQVHGTLIRMNKKAEYEVSKRVLDTGPDAGTYYKVVMV